MCGIAGVVSESASRAALVDAVRHMITVQRHRGPDGEGFYDSTGVAFGHCRLAIIDQSTTGHQPMSDAQGRYWITYNGEIYNYLELRDQLRQLGCRFRGQSDTEVLLAAYSVWGSDCLEKLRGMFAFAIWDEKERSLFAARDRLGIKPFHYWHDATGTLAFASELKALLEFLPDRKAHLTLAQDFLAWGLIDHDPLHTMIAGINRLPAGHAMTWNRDRGIQSWSYWTVTVSEELETPAHTYSDLTSNFRRRFMETVQIHLRSDVAVGTCLSGGLDSSAIACVVSATMSQQHSPVQAAQHTFSACFAEPELNERIYMDAVIKSTGATAHYVYPRGEDLALELPRMLWHQEEPIGGFGVYAQYCVAKLAHLNGVKVLLDGQGADEQLAGYRKFILTYIRQLLGNRQYLRAAWETAAFFASPDILRTTFLKDGRRYLLPWLADGDHLWAQGAQPRRPPSLGISPTVGQRLQADLLLYSLPALLRFEDRNMMAFGVESRVPFVDHLLVEWVATLPAAVRLSGGWTKRILRDALRGIFPDLIRTRRSKLGFVTPASKWLAGPLADWFNDTLSSPRHLGDVVDLQGVKHVLRRRQAGDRSSSLEDRLFYLAMYETWARLFLDQPSAKARSGGVAGTIASRNGHAAHSVVSM